MKDQHQSELMVDHCNRIYKENDTLIVYCYLKNVHSYIILYYFSSQFFLFVGLPDQESFSTSKLCEGAEELFRRG